MGFNMNFQHKDLKDRWLLFSFPHQMLNIGSEVSRALNWKDKDKIISENSFFRALELIFFTIESLQKNNDLNKIKELCLSKEVLYDYFFGNNEYDSNPDNLMKYYNDFITLV